MTDYGDILNGVVDDDIEQYVGDGFKSQVLIVEQGVSKALINTYITQAVIANDETTTSGSTYLQYADGSIKKWGSDNIRYSAPSGTLWADRATATYTAETV